VDVVLDGMAPSDAHEGKQFVLLMRALNVSNRRGMRMRSEAAAARRRSRSIEMYAVQVAPDWFPVSTQMRRTRRPGCRRGTLSRLMWPMSFGVGVADVEVLGPGRAAGVSA